MCSTRSDNDNGTSLTQKETGEWSVPFETMEKHYKELVRQSSKISGEASRRKWTETKEDKKMYDSAHNTTMRIGRKWFKGSWESTWKQQENVTVTLGNIHTRSLGYFQWNENYPKIVWQSTQDSHENGSLMTQKEETKWSIHFEVMDKHYRYLYDS